jgi:hypothetical protein
VGVGAKVTVLPEHIAPDGFAEILILGVTDGLTVILVVGDVAVVGLTQFAVEVMTQ